MSDLIFAMELSLRAAGYKPIEPTEPPLPFPSILQELVDYVHSPEYQQLIINEQKQTHENSRTNQKRF